MQSAQQPFPDFQDIKEFIKYLNEELSFDISNPFQGMEIICAALKKAKETDLNSVEEFKTFFEHNNTSLFSISQDEFDNILEQFKNERKSDGSVELYQQIFDKYERLYESYVVQELRSLGLAKELAILKLGNANCALLEIQKELDDEIDLPTAEENVAKAQEHLAECEDAYNNCIDMYVYSYN
jgi:hypothetical protein